MSYLTKLKGSPAPVPPRPPLKELGFISFGAFLAACVIGYLAYATNQPIIMGPRNVIIGHLVTTLIGLVFYHLVSSDWWSMALALAFAIAAMQYLRVPHPPAGSNPFIVFLLGSQWDFLWMPALIGSVLIVLVALFYNNLSNDRSYPKYW